MERVSEEDLKRNLSDSNASASFSPDATWFLEYRLAVLIWQIYSPCVLFVGVFGNVATILVMRRIKDHNSSSSQYAVLTSLAVSDLCLVAVLVPREWVRHVFHVDLWHVHSVPCKLQGLTYAVNTTSAWLVTLVTLQRTMAVLWPHRMRSLCTVRRTWMVIAALVALSLALYCHLLVGMELRDGRCQVLPGPYAFFFRHVFTWADLSLSSLLPSVCLLVCDLILSVTLYQSTDVIAHAHAHAHQATIPNSVTKSSSVSKNSVSKNVTKNVSDTRKKKASRTTLMVLALSLTFLALTMPMYGFYVFWYADEDALMVQTPRMVAVYKLVSTVVHELWFTNMAVNFLLYCLTGTKYRKEFVRLLRCRCSSARSSDSSRSSNSSVGSS